MIPVRSRRRCRQRQLPQPYKTGRKLHPMRCCPWILALLASRSQHSFITDAYTYSSPLFKSATSTTRRSGTGQNSVKSGRKRSSILHMVLTTPESIIEQASTQKLLDVLLDESTRTTARRPIMMQFDPSSGAVSMMI